ncbi:MAG: O-antigen ligase family protein, partial [Actinomycetes bacterium]
EVGAALLVAGSLVWIGMSFQVPGVLLALLLIMLSWFMVELVLYPTGDAGQRRFLHLTLWLAVLAVFSSPKAPRRMLGLGVLLGGAASSLATIFVVSVYPGRVVGLFGDPNALAAVVVVLAPIAIEQFHGRRARLALWLGAVALVVLTLSRTGIVSIAVAASVYALFPLIRGWVVAIAAAAGTVLWIAPADIRASGPFDLRDGSDDLRERIRTAGADSVAESWWTGHGLGTAKVNLGRWGWGDYTFFFHNSYYALVSETGLIGATIVLLTVAGGTWRAMKNPLARGALAGVCAGLVMATQLGEVLVDLPMAIVIGMCWSPIAGFGSEAVLADATASVAASPSVR